MVEEVENLNSDSAILLDICGGDVFAFWQACQKYGGITVNIPKKKHKPAFVRELAKSGIAVSEIAQRLHLPKRSVKRWIQMNS